MSIKPGCYCLLTAAHTGQCRRRSSLPLSPGLVRNSNCSPVSSQCRARAPTFTPSSSSGDEPGFPCCGVEPLTRERVDGRAYAPMIRELTGKQFEMLSRQSSSGSPIAQSVLDLPRRATPNWRFDPPGAVSLPTLRSRLHRKIDENSFLSLRYRTD